MKLTHGSLFAGIGGFDLGFERAGFTSVWQVECDPYCLKVLEKNFRHARRYTDIRTVHVSVPAHIEDRERRCDNCLIRVDVITGGFPCQPYSSANRFKSENDNRILWPEMCRVVAELQPSFVVAENVPGIGVYLDSVQADLEAVGYEAYPLRLPACAYGTAFLGERVYLVAASTSERWSANEIHDSATHQGHPTQRDSGTEWRLRTQPLAPTSETLRDLLSTESYRAPDGFPGGVDRLRALGNAVVPQIAEAIAWSIRQTIEHPAPSVGPDRA